MHIYYYIIYSILSNPNSIQQQACYSIFSFLAKISSSLQVVHHYSKGNLCNILIKTNIHTELLTHKYLNTALDLFTLHSVAIYITATTVTKNILDPQNTIPIVLDFNIFHIFYVSIYKDVVTSVSKINSKMLYPFGKSVDLFL